MIKKIYDDEMMMMMNDDDDDDVLPPVNELALNRSWTVLGLIGRLVAWRAHLLLNHSVLIFIILIIIILIKIILIIIIITWTVLHSWKGTFLHSSSYTVSHFSTF